jgi:predicted DNA binding protein
MAVIAEFSVDHVDFALESVFAAHADATVELDRVVPTDEAFLPYFWVWDADVDDVVDVADVVREADPLSEMELVDEVDGGGLFRAWWTRDVGGLLAATEAANLTLRKGVGSADGWLFELRAEHPEALSTYQRYLAENDVDAELVRMHELDDDSTTSRYNLTPEQREALLTAYDGGYYDQPTDTDLESLADELSISRSAFSARLKRGYRNLVEATIAHEQEPNADR